MRISIPFVILPTLLLALVLTACDRPPPVRDERPRPVRSIVVEPEQTASALTLPGEVHPRIETRYGFRVGGKIAERMVSVGDRITAGQVLARLDPKDVEPAVAQARAQVQAASTEAKLAHVELERLKDLHRQNFVSLAQVDRQQAQTDASDARLRNAQAQLAQARNTMAFQSLVADADGVVTAIDAEEGQVVAAGQSVVRAARTAEKELLVNVPEGDLPIAREAKTWQVTIPALGDEPLQARVRELSPVADPASRTYPMRLSLLGDTSAVALGMSATAWALRDAGETIVLPISALYSQDGETRVWVVADDLSVKPVPVKTGGFLDDAVRITGGLEAGDRVVTAGANLLVAGQKVRLLDGSAETAAKATVAVDSAPGGDAR